MKAGARKDALTWSFASYWPLLTILLVTFAIYGWSLTFDFLSWDDDQNITQNPWILKGEWLRFWREHFVGMYVPLVYTVWFGLSKLGSGFDPKWFHACNLFVHGINAILVYLLASHSVDKENQETRRSTGIAFLAALLFALHPLQVEAVAWVTGLRDLLSTSLVLTAAMVSLYRGYRIQREVLGFVIFVGALLCKPSAAVVPVAFAVLAVATGICNVRLAALKYAPWLAMGAVAVIATKNIQTEVISFAVPAISFVSRLLVTLDSYGFYLSKLFLPIGLAVDYGRTPQKMIDGTHYVSTVSWVLIAIMVLAASFRRLNKRELGWLCFAVITLAPTSGLVSFAFQHVSTVADHYMYLPLVGIVLFGVSILGRTSNKYVVAAAACLIPICAGLSLYRMSIWRDDKALFSSMLAANSDSYGGHIGMVAIAMKEGRYAEALPNLREAERLEPTNVVTLLDKWLLYVKLERFKEVVEDKPGHMLTKEQIRANPNSASTIAGQYVVLAYAQMRLGDFRGSFETSCLARFADPEHPDLPKFFPFLGGKLGLSPPAERWCPE